MMKNILTVAFILYFVLSAFAGDINIVTTIPDFADIAKNIVGDKAEVYSIMKGWQDPHSVEPRPSAVLKVRNADIVIVVGMDLDMWIDGLLGAAKNSRVLKGSTGYLDLSLHIDKLEVPEGKVDGSMGDVHIYGNPHYWLNPENGKIIAKDIYIKLVELYPEQKEYFELNYTKYIKNLDAMIAKTKQQIKKIEDKTAVFSHNCWIYLAQYCKLKVIGFVEPKPGIAPSPSDIVELINKMKKNEVKAMFVEPFFNMSAPEKISQKTGAKIVVMPTSVGGIEGANTYIDLIEQNVSKIVTAISE